MKFSIDRSRLDRYVGEARAASEAASQSNRALVNARNVLRHAEAELAKVQSKPGRDAEDRIAFAAAGLERARAAFGAATAAHEAASRLSRQKGGLARACTDYAGDRGVKLES